MASISMSDARQLFTKSLADVYRETNTATLFLQGFFKVKESATKEVSIEVIRGNEKVAVDVLRGTQGNRNTISTFTEKIFIPPYFREYFDATDLDFYDRLFGTENSDINSITFRSWLEIISDKLRMLQSKIERAYEIQAAQVFQTGIVTLVNGDNIDFKRKVGSMVVAADFWNTGPSNPFTDLEAGGTFLRKVGKAGGNLFNVIMAGEVLDAFLNNGEVTTRADVRRFMLDDISAPRKVALGQTYHGRVSAGAYSFDLWTYAQFFDDRAAANASTPYIDANNLVILPQDPNFVHAFAGVPFLRTMPEGSPLPQMMDRTQGQYVIGNYIDQILESHVFDIKSAGLPIPTAVDQIYTLQALA